MGIAEEFEAVNGANGSTIPAINHEYNSEQACQTSRGVQNAPKPHAKLFLPTVPARYPSAKPGSENAKRFKQTASP